MADTTTYASRLDDDGSIAAMWRDHRQEGIDNCSKIWEESRTRKRFAARQQWPKDKEQTDPDRPRPRLTVPETSRVLAAFSGRQIMQRVEREYIPQNQDSARWAETWTKVDKAICQACDGEQVDSSAFRDGPGIQGISWVRWYVDDWTSSEPQLRYETVPIWNMIWPATRLINLQDRGWQRWGSWWPQSTVKARWPTKYDEIKTLIGTKQWTDIQQRTNVHSRIPWTGGPGNKPLSGTDGLYDPKSRSLFIEYEEYRELETYFEVAKPIDPAMTYAEAFDVDRQRIVALSDSSTATTAPNDPMERVEMSIDELRAYRRERQTTMNEDVPDDIVARKQRMKYRYIYGCGDVILEIGDIDQQCFTFQAMAAEVVELDDETLYIPLLADLIDAQRMVNYMMSALIRDIQINPKGGLIVERGLFRNKKDAIDAWVSWGGVVEVERGRLTGSGGNRPFEHVPNPPTQITSKLESMLSFYREAIPRLAGFNPAALGQLGTDIRRVSGEVVRQLADATMTSNAERIDSLRLYRREGARIFMAFARTLWKPEDLVRFIGESEAYDDVLNPETMLPTGERVLTIPPKEAWRPDYWKEIAIEEVQPSDDALSGFWDTLQTQVQLLQSPMPDTGQPLFQAEDWIKLFPKMPAAMRQKMLARIKMQQHKFQQQKMMQEQQQQQQLQQQQAEQGQQEAASEPQAA